MSSLPVDWRLPAGWEMKPLGEVATLQRGFDLPVQDRQEGSFKIFAANGPVGTHNEPKVQGPGVVTGRSGSIGKVNYVEEDYWPLNTSLWVKDFHGNDPRWVSRLLTWMHLEKFTRGVGVPTLNRNLVHEVEIPLPPLEEQKRIAGILDQADALRRLRTRALDKLGTLGQAIFHEMFGGTVKPVSVQQLLDDGVLLLHKDGNHGSNYPRKEEFGTDGVPFLSAKAIDDDGRYLAEEIEFLNDAKAQSLKIGWIKAGDVLLSHNASVGKVAQYAGEFGEALIGTSLTCFRPNPDRLKSGFLEFALRSYSFQSQLKSNMSQTTRNQVPITAQKRLELTIPSLEEQAAFEGKTSFISEAFVAGKKALREQNSLFASLQHRAFRGDL